MRAEVGEVPCTLRVTPVDVCSGPAVVPLETARPHCGVGASGSCASRWIGRTGDSLPLASAEISCPALTEAVVLPVTPTVPSKTLIRFELSWRTSISNCVPRTEALTEWPPTLKVAPLTRCCTLTKVRPTFCATSADCRLPFFCSWTVVIWTVVSRSEEHTSELQSQSNLVCRLLLE